MLFGITKLVLRNGYFNLFYRFSTLSLTLLHKVKIFRFSSLNSRNGLPILASPSLESVQVVKNMLICNNIWDLVQVRTEFKVQKIL